MANRLLVSNFAVGRLFAVTAKGSGTIVLLGGEGAAFPGAFTAGDYAIAIVVDSANAYSIVQFTSRTGDTLSGVTWDHQGTAGPANFAANSNVYLFPTKGHHDAYVQIDADETITGDKTFTGAVTTPNVPAGNIVATTTQAAINELDTEKAGLSLNNTFTGANTHTSVETFNNARVNNQGAGNDSVDNYDGIEADNRAFYNAWRRKVAGVPLNRWVFGMDNRNGVYGGDVLFLNAYDDAGAFVGTLFQFRRDIKVSMFTRAAGSVNSNAGNISGAWSPDLAVSNSIAATLNGNVTTITPTNALSGFTYIFKLLQDGTGNRTLAWPTNFKFPGGIKPPLSTGAGAADLLSFTYDGVNYLCSLSKAFG